MSQSYCHNLVHCVFGTKDRRDCIRDPRALWRYIVAVAYAKSIHVVAAGGTTNHVHLLMLVPQTMAVAKAMQEIKSNSSRWARETSRLFQWQRGYGAFSVSESQRRVVEHYIANQAEHHRKWSFEEEYLALLKKAGVQYDPRYVFE
jgi:REP element-mobilizing transposase RayT